MKKLLVTNALFYANGPIHLGHLVEVIQTDIFVRYQRLLRGREVIYVGGDDTHGTPIELNAQKQGVTPEALISRVFEEHQRDFRDFEIGFDSYGSTHTDANRRFAELIFERLTKGKHVERRPLDLTYCEVDQRFLPDRFVRGICPRCGSPDQYGDVCEVCKSTYSPIDLKEPRCAICGSVPVRRSSDHYFFKLNDFLPLLTGIAQGTERPALDPSIQRFLQGWIEQGLQDWCISRDGPYFGFRIPGEKEKYFYVWLDAPVGYISILDTHLRDRGAKDTSGLEGADRLWSTKADSEIWHFIGKDIIYFHALFWPAMLRGAGFRLPDRIVVHGMLGVKGEKLSKSRGRPMTARGYLDLGLSPEHLRYYFAANLTPAPNDIDLNVDDFRHRVNAELVNNIANFCHRTLSLLRSRFEGKLKLDARDPEAVALWTGAIERLHGAAQGYEALEFRQAMAGVVAACGLGNEFLQRKKPWELGPTAQSDLSWCANLALGAAALLQPVAPQMAAAVLAQLGRGSASLAELGLDLAGSAPPPRPWMPEGQVHDGAPMLMPRIEPAAARALLPVEESLEETPTATKRPTATPTATPTTTPTTTPTSKEQAEKVGQGPAASINMDAFIAIDLRCGVILSAQPVPGATKLLELRVELGEAEPRTIASGIAEAYQPEALVGRRVVVVANLAPKTIRGVRSHGMLLAAGEGANIALVEVPGSLAAGTRVR
jgi:methionyl-tRNA synthetase